jgi:hypothetical protein
LALRTIARDEQGHADLARQILSYCLSAGGRAVRNTLVENLERRRAEEEARIDMADEPAAEIEIDEDFAQKYGLPGQDITRAARAETWEKSAALLAHA